VLLAVRVNRAAATEIYTLVVTASLERGSLGRLETRAEEAPAGRRAFARRRPAAARARSTG
jgi:hypothetical protein